MAVSGLAAVSMLVQAPMLEGGQIAPAPAPRVRAMCA
jgi:hypothetical protein